MRLKKLREKFLLELSSVYTEEESKYFFYLLSEHYLDKSRLDLALEPEIEVDASVSDDFERALLGLKTERPIQHILGQMEFMELIFEVNENVLIPRPETEELINWILSLRKNETGLNILDIGTGSGCIPVVLAKKLIGANIHALDVSAEALEVAEKNARRNNASLHFIQNDILDPGVLPDQLDIIVSNPPYVRMSERSSMRKNVLDYEPALALFVSDEDPLLFYSKIAQLGKNILKQNGELFLEINQYLGEQLVHLLQNEGYSDVKLRKDMYGADRMVRATKK